MSTDHSVITTIGHNWNFTIFIMQIKLSDWRRRSSTTVSPQIITPAWSQGRPVRAEEPEMKVLLALTFLLAFLALGLSEPDTDRDLQLLRDKREPASWDKKETATA